MCTAARVFAEEGKLAEALAEFRTAVDIDPSSFIAQQEIRRTQEDDRRLHQRHAAPGRR